MKLMSPGTGVASGMQAALLLARGRADGIARVQAEPQAAARSFWAMALSLPAFLCLRLIDWMDTGLPLHPAHAVGLDLLLYVVGWLGYVELSRPLAVLLGRGGRWPLFIALWNWCNVVQYLLLVAAAIPALLGAPDWLAETASLVAVGWALWLEWFAAKLALGVPGAAAAMLVVLDLMVGLAVALATSALG
jgi:hypothetical protein